MLIQNIASFLSYAFSEAALATKNSDVKENSFCCQKLEIVITYESTLRHLGKV